MNSIPSLIAKIEELKRSEISTVVKQRISQFLSLKEKHSKEIFKELCFCILTANFSAERSILIQEKLRDKFLYTDKETLAGYLKKFGHRYPEKRAEYIVSARKYMDSIKEIIFSIQEREGKRLWLVKNIKGIGYKEASHFLRNIGFLDYAIVDFHIIDLLEREGLIKRPKSLTKKKYLQIESVLKEIASQVCLPVGKLDLYLWYMETGKVLK